MAPQYLSSSPSLTQAGGLRFGQRIALRSEDAEGYVTADVQTNSAQIRPAMDPYFFERFVFSVDPVDEHLDAEAETKDNGAVAYGQLIRLRHPLTERYLCVDKKAHAQTQTDCFKVLLHNTEGRPDDEGLVANDKASTFFIRPRYNVRHEGDIVRFSDQITLVANFDNRRGAPRYLHIALTSEMDGDGAFSEVNCSLAPTAWILHLYDAMTVRGSADGDAAAIRAGTPIILFQKVIAGYLVADPHIEPLPSTPVKPKATAASLEMSCDLDRSQIVAESSFDPLLSSSSFPVAGMADQSKRVRLEKMKLNRFISQLNEEEAMRDEVYFEHAHGDDGVRPPYTAQASGCVRSSNALWLAEGRDSRKGGYLHFHRPYRLRNIASNLYLGVKKHEAQFLLFLTADTSGDATVFVFVPADDANGGPVWDNVSMLRIQHRRTGHVLHTSRQGPPDGSTETFTPLSLAPKALAQDMFVVGQPDPQLAVQLQWVLARKRILQAMVDRFPASRVKYASPEVQKTIQLAIDALSDLVLFCTDCSDANPFTREGTPIPSHQRLLLEQGLHSVVVELLRLPFQPVSKAATALQLAELTHHQHWSLYRACVLGYRVLKQMVTGSPANGRKLSQFIPFMQTQLFSPLPVADTVSEIFKGNRPMLEQLTEDVIECFLGLESQRQDASYLNFLCQLCVCDGVGIPKNQRIIAWYVTNPQNHRLLPLELDPITGRNRIAIPASYSFTEPIQITNRSRALKSGAQTSPRISMKALVRGLSALSSRGPKLNVAAPGSPTLSPMGSPKGSPGGSPKVSPGTSPKGSASSVNDEKDLPWTDLATFCQEAPDAAVQYLHASLRLLWHLCLGDNPQCRALVQPLVTKDMILAAIGAEAPRHRLPEGLQSQFLYLGTHLYLSKPSQGGPTAGLVGGQPHKVIPWSAIKVPRRVERCATPRCAADPFAQRLRQAVIAVLRGLPPPRAWDAAVTDLAKGALEMLVQVVRYKQYTSADLDEILSHVLPLLQEFKDVDAGVADCQKVVCAFLDHVLEHSLDLCLDTVLAHWKRLLSLTPTALAEGGETVRQAVLKDSLVGIAPILEDFSVAMPPQPTEEKWEGFLLVFHKHFEVHTTAIVRTLLCLATSPDVQLVDSALTLLFRLFSFKTEFCRKVFTVELMFDERSERQYNAFCTKAAVLQRLRELRSTDECAEVAGCLAQINQQLRLLCGAEASLEDSMSSLERPMSLSGPGVPRSRSTSSLGFMVGSAGQAHDHLSSSGLFREQQGVLRNMGLHTLVLSLLAAPPGAGVETADQQRVWAEAYQFLALFCLGNARNQHALFAADRLGLFMQHVGLDVHAEECVQAIFQDNAELCQQVDPDDIPAHVQEACGSGPRQEWHLQLLTTITVARGQPLLQNQELVLSALMSHSVPWLRLLGEPLEEETGRSCQGVVELLTLCSLGQRNPLRESVRGLLDVELVLALLVPGEPVATVPLQERLVRYLAEVWWHDADNPTLHEDWMLSDPWWSLVKQFLEFMDQLLADASQGEEPDESGLDVQFLMEVVVFGMQQFLECCWPTATLQSCKVHPDAAQCTETLLDLLVALVWDTRALDSLNFQSTHFQAMERLLLTYQTALPECKPQAIQEALEESRRYSGPARDPGEVSEAEAKEEEEAENVASNIRFAFQTLRQAMCGRYYKPTLDDFQLMTDCVEPHLGPPLLAALLGHLGRANLPQPSQLGLLRLFTTLLRRAVDAVDQLGGRQALLDVQHRFHGYGAAECMADLVERPDDVVTEAAADFGIALLHGGPSALQDTLVTHFSTPRSRFFSRLSALLRQQAAILRQQPMPTSARSPLDSVGPQFEGPAFFDRQPTDTDAAAEVALDDASAAHPRPILRLLQLLCEGHHLRMQQLMWSQKAVQPIDMVKEVVDLLREVVSMKVSLDQDRELLTTALYAFNALTEFCQGPCDVNQSHVVTCNACVEADKVLTGSMEVEESLGFAVQSAAITMLISLLEGCRDRTRPTLILRALRLDNLGQMLDHVYRQLQGSGPAGWYLLDGQQEQTLDVGFSVFVLLQQLKALSEDERLTACLEASTAAPYFAAMMSTIEIARGDVVEKVYFRKPLNAGDLSDEVKSQLLRTIDRSAPTAKLIDFCAKSSHLMYELQHQNYIRRLLHQHLPGVRPLTGGSVLCRLYNVLVASRLERLRSRIIEKVPSQGAVPFENATLVLAFTVNVVYGCIHTHPRLIDRYAGTCTAVPLLPASDYPLLMLLVRLLSLGLTVSTGSIAAALGFLHLPIALRHANGGRESSEEGGPDRAVRHRLAQLWALPRNVQAYYGYVALLLVACFLGQWVSPLFYCSHTLLLIKRSVVVQHIIEAVSRNGRSLLLTALLGIIFVYLFTAIGYQLFPEDFAGEHTHNCVTLFQCFVFSLTSGARAGGGLGELLPAHAWGSPRHAVRLVYDFAFFLIVPIILLNIVFGIILDTFAQLRTEREKVEEDMSAHCFVCGIQAYTFDRYTKGGFAWHVKAEHNVWDYFFFLQHLQLKEPDEYTGQESYVCHKVQRNDISFFPMNRALGVAAESQGLGTVQPLGLPDAGGVPIPEDFARRLAFMENRMFAQKFLGSPQMPDSTRNGPSPWGGNPRFEDSWQSPGETTPSGRSISNAGGSPKSILANAMPASPTGMYRRILQLEDRLEQLSKAKESEMQPAPNGNLSTAEYVWERQLSGHPVDQRSSSLLKRRAQAAQTGSPRRNSGQSIISQGRQCSFALPLTASHIEGSDEDESSPSHSPNFQGSMQSPSLRTSRATQSPSGRPINREMRFPSGRIRRTDTASSLQSSISSPRVPKPALANSPRKSSSHSSQGRQCSFAPPLSASRVEGSEASSPTSSASPTFQANSQVRIVRSPAAAPRLPKAEPRFPSGRPRRPSVIASPCVPKRPDVPVAGQSAVEVSLEEIGLADLLPATPAPPKPGAALPALPPVPEVVVSRVGCTPPLAVAPRRAGSLAAPDPADEPAGPAPASTLPAYSFPADPLPPYAFPAPRPAAAKPPTPELCPHPSVTAADSSPLRDAVLREASGEAQQSPPMAEQFSEVELWQRTEKLEEALKTIALRLSTDPSMSPRVAGYTLPPVRQGSPAMNLAATQCGATHSPPAGSAPLSVTVSSSSDVSDPLREVTDYDH